MLIDKTADELLSMQPDDLKFFRAQLFLGGRRKADTLEQSRALLDFTSLLSLVQSIADWRRLTEPGIAGTLMQVEDEDPEVLAEMIEQARELDRLSIEDHNDVAAEFERRGGKPALQEAIDRLNELHA